MCGLEGAQASCFAGGVGGLLANTVYIAVWEMGVAWSVRGFIVQLILGFLIDPFSPKAYLDCSPVGDWVTTATPPKPILVGLLPLSMLGFLQRCYSHATVLSARH